MLLDEILNQKDIHPQKKHSPYCSCSKCLSKNNILEREFSLSDIFDFFKPTKRLDEQQLQKAIEYNKRKGPELGWASYYDDIVEKVLKLNYSPDEAAFAQAVANWQANNGYSGKYIDGKLGSGTWGKMQDLIIDSSSNSNLNADYFENFTDINRFFLDKTGLGFIDWFNRRVALKNYWRRRKIRNEEKVIKRFKEIWDNIPEIFDSKRINLNQFLVLSAIMINENSRFSSRSEKGPNLKYFFESVRLKSGRRKISYNTKYNKTAFELFNDNYFVNAHGHLNPKKLQYTSDSRWKGAIYPNEYSDSIDPIRNGFIMEADFFKFRGRGFIQITFRGNYRRQIQEILKYTGTNNKILFYKRKWSKYLHISDGQINKKSLDIIATVSSNKDWNDLFNDDDLAFPLLSIKTYYKYKSRSRKNPLKEISSGNIHSAEVKNKIKLVARAQGGSDYEQKLFNRVKQMYDSI